MKHWIAKRAFTSDIAVAITFIMCKQSITTFHVKYRKIT